MSQRLFGTPEPVDERTRVAMVREYFDVSRYSLVVAVLLICVHTLVVAGEVSKPLLLAWLLASAALLATRAVWRQRCLASTPEALLQQLVPWRRRAIAGAGGAGLMWALALLMAFETHDVTAQMYCATFACLTVVGSVNVMAPVPRAFHAVALPIALTLALQFLSLATWAGLYLGSLVLVVAVMAVGLVHRYARLLFESHALRFEREQMLLRLQEADTAKSRFLAAASHDLRQPLHALGLLATQVREELEGRRAAQTAERIETMVGALDSLVVALMDISRLDSGALKLQPQAMPLAPVFDRLSAEFALLAEEKGLQWRLRPTTLWVQSDPVQLERMLRNLLSNALRYTPSGGVLLAARQRGGQVCISVWDTGPGIAAEHQQRVFDEFVQLHNPGRDRSPGLGLGLAIVARQAKLLGHSVGLRSRLLRGSCFSINAAVAVAQSQPEPAPLDLEPLAARRVLLVEDDDAVRVATLSLLQRWGCQVQTAANLAALKALDVPRLASADAAGAAGASALPADTAPRLVVDWRLPDGDGLQAITSLRQRLGQAVPALLLSGETLSPQALAQAQAEAVTVARKPLPPAALRAWLHG